MNDKELGFAIRAALLAMVAAIERYFGIGKHAKGKEVKIDERDSVAGMAIENQKE